MNDTKAELLLSYLAGVFDGEGCIEVRKNPKEGTWLVRCRVGTAGDTLPKLFHTTFGGSLGQLQRNQTHWDISHRKALVFLESILPYLKLKAPQAEVAIGMQRRIQKFKPCRNRPIPKNELALREAELILVRRLKEESYGKYQ